MKAAFTIVAKNYLARARTLGGSLKRTNPDVDFCVFLADEAEGAVDLSKEDVRVVEAKDIGIRRFREMAFKYDILEFCCAIKPFCFDYLFEHLGYDKALYFDPDVYVVNSLASIYELLTPNFLVLTPHLTRLSAENDGATREEEILYVGVYNLGFAGIKKCQESKRLLDWWKVRLEDGSFADRADALHVDQKWMDLVPWFFEAGVHVSRDPGYNAAFWNMHERELRTEDGRYIINGRPLVFCHVAAFDPRNVHQIAGRQSKYSLDNRPEYRDLLEGYANQLLANDFEECSKLPYAYATYENGIGIFSFQRRMYRTLLTQYTFATDPFSTSPGSFYDILRKNGLLIHEKRRREYWKADVRGGRQADVYLRKGLRVLKGLLGIKYYYMTMRWLVRNCRPEEQTFLITKGLSSKAGMAARRE